MGFLARILGRGAAGSGSPKGGVAKVGWFVLTDEAEFIWDAPRPSLREPQEARSVKSVLVCPAVIDYEARLYEVACPVDLHLRLAHDDKGQPVIVNAAGAASPVIPAKLKKLVALTPPSQWRDPQRPVVQVVTPYRLISDDLVYVNQMPIFQHYRAQPLPGLLIGGRYPVDAWPRPLMWAFEWHEPKKDIVLRRGEPWFTLRFETEDPKAQVRLVEAELTPDLLRQCKGVDSVTNYVNRTFSLFPTARARRPPSLLVERRTARDAEQGQGRG